MHALALNETASIPEKIVEDSRSSMGGKHIQRQSSGKYTPLDCDDEEGCFSAPFGLGADDEITLPQMPGKDGAEGVVTLHENEPSSQLVHSTNSKRNSQSLSKSKRRSTRSSTPVALDADADLDAAEGFAADSHPAPSSHKDFLNFLSDDKIRSIISEPENSTLSELLYGKYTISDGETPESPLCVSSSAWNDTLVQHDDDDGILPMQHRKDAFRIRRSSLLRISRKSDKKRNINSVKMGSSSKQRQCSHSRTTSVSSSATAGSDRNSLLSSGNSQKWRRRRKKKGRSLLGLSKLRDFLR